MQDPNQGDSNVEVAQQTKPGEALGFTLKGNGVINESPGETASGAAQQQDQGPQAQGRDSRAADNRPGGGLGVPIDAPDALQKYRWPILFGFATLLAIGGWVVTKRQPPANVAASVGTSAVAKPGSASSDYSGTVRTSPTPATAAAAPAPRSSMLLEALKEELFQLEVEKKQGKITPEDYEKAKAALDQTLDRALKRQG
jgi:hypothetical protein